MRIINLGLPKTGTKSLKFALKTLGFIEGEKDDFPETPNRFYSFDWVHHVDHKELIKKYPDSVFLLTYRDPEKWYRSECKWSLLPHHLRIPWLLDQRTRLYGYPMPQGHKAEYIKRYEQYYRSTIDYFYLINKMIYLFEWREGDHKENWRQLCDVFKKPIPNIDFPHENKQKF